MARKVARQFLGLQNGLRHEWDQAVLPSLGRAFNFDDVFFAGVFGNQIWFSVSGIRFLPDLPPALSKHLSHQALDLCLFVARCMQ